MLEQLNITNLIKIDILICKTDPLCCIPETNTTF